LKKIIVASHNPTKIRSALAGFQAMFPDEEFSVQGIAVSSGVSDQPMSDAETLQGAMQRAQATHELEPAADFWVGMEGGVEETEHGLESFAWIVVQSATLSGKAKTGTLFLPAPIAELIHNGVELGDAIDQVFATFYSKHNAGAVGMLTNNLIDRTAYYRLAVILALIPFKNMALYA
jgi:inosine/xanthosine triphosphatase